MVQEFCALANTDVLGLSSWRLGRIVVDTATILKVRIAEYRDETFSDFQTALLPGATISLANHPDYTRHRTTCEMPSSDRTFHDHTTDRCLPLMDHYCVWIHVCVYSRTMKAYLYFVLELTTVDSSTVLQLTFDRLKVHT